MTSRPEAALTLQDLPRIVTKYRRLMILGTVLSTVLFTLASFVLPKKYKTHFVLTIYTKYFQSPLIGEFVPELSDSGDIISQREALIRQVLTPSYVDSLGERYGIFAPHGNRAKASSWYQKWRSELKVWCMAHGLYQPPNPASEISAEREDLLSRINIFGLNSTTFNISFIYNDPDVTYRVTQDIYNQVIQSLLEIRMHTLTNIRDVIRERVGSLQGGPSSPEKISLLQEDLAEVRNQISALSSQYTEEHPRMKELRTHERVLLSRLAVSGEGRAGHLPVAVNRGLDRASQGDLNSDLMRKLNYLNIAIKFNQQNPADYFAMLESPLYPDAPLWPKPPLFALWGLGFGLFGSLFIAALWEYFDRSALHASDIAHHLGVPLLGEIPVFPWKSIMSTRLIDAPQQPPPGLN
jgi:hypothetical protein